MRSSQPWQSTTRWSGTTSTAAATRTASEPNSRWSPSPHVSREVEHAASSGKAILPLRIDDVPPSKALGYFLSTAHRLDAFPPLERHLERVASTARELLDSTEAEPVAPRASV